MNYMDIFNDIKKASISKLYLFYGPEEYIKDQAMSSLKDSLIDPSFGDLNYQLLEGTEMSVQDIINASETLPFMGDKRLVIVRESPFLKAGGRKGANEEGEVDRLSKYLGTLPATTCLVFFYRGEIDKRKRKLLDAIRKNGKLIEFSLLSERDLIKWVDQTTKRYGKRMQVPDIQYLVFFTGKKLEDIHNELLKLIGYVGDREEIGREDIDQVVTKTLEHNIFQMLDDLGAKKSGDALAMLQKMMVGGENCLGILTMIARQIRLILQTGLLHSQGYSSKAIGERLKLSPFIVSKLIQQGKGFSPQQLQSFLSMCQSADYDIKSGKISDQLAVEMLILKMGQ